MATMNICNLNRIMPLSEDDKSIDMVFEDLDKLFDFDA